MKSQHRIALRKDVPANQGADALAGTIARLEEENEVLRRLVALLNAQLNLARGSFFEDQQPSH